MFDFRLIFVSVVWGVNFSFVKFALADFLPMSFTVVRFFLGALFLVSIMLITREPLSIERRDLAGVMKLGLVGITLYNIFFMYGLKYTTASHSALFIALSPLFAAVIQAFRGKERLTQNSIIGLGLSTLGAYLTIQSHRGRLSFPSHGFVGDLLTLCAAIFWALYTMKAEPLLGKYSPVKVTAYSMAAGSVPLLPLGLYDMAHQSWETISLLSWASLAFAAFIAGGVAFSLWYQGVKKLGVTRTIVYHYLVPFVAVLFAAMFLRERITFLQILGGAVVLAGVYLVQKRKAS